MAKEPKTRPQSLRHPGQSLDEKIDRVVLGLLQYDTKRQFSRHGLEAVPAAMGIFTIEDGFKPGRMQRFR